MRIIFMGTPDFAVPALRAIREAGHEIAAVYTQPPRAAGRGMALRKSPVQQEAEQAGLTVLTPERLKSAEEQERFRALNADAAVVVAYGQILPQVPSSKPRATAPSTSTPRCCRAGGAPPPSTAPSWPATGRPASPSCGSPRASTRDPSACEARIPIGRDETAGELHDRLAAEGAALYGRGACRARSRQPRLPSAAEKTALPTRRRSSRARRASPGTGLRRKCMT